MNKNEGFFLINKKRTHVKRFRKFENISKEENDFIQIEYGSVYKSSTKPVYKGSRIESLKDATNEDKKNSQKKFGRKQVFLKIIFKNQLKTNLN